MTTAYEELISVLYSEKDREALEWAIGSIIHDGPKKTVVIYGDAATGKSTMTKIIKTMFEDRTIYAEHKGIWAVDVQGHLFMEFIRPPNVEEINAMPDVILVSTTGKRHGPGRYQQLVNEIYENPDELRLIAMNCYERFSRLGAFYYDHTIPSHIPEENTQ